MVCEELFMVYLIIGTLFAFVLGLVLGAIGRLRRWW